MDLEMLESMAQDEMTMQDTPIMQVDYSPQINAESAMGAAAGAAVYDTPPPLLRQNPSSVPGGSAPDNGEATATRPLDMAQLLEILLAKMDGNALEAKNMMKNEMKEMRGEMQRMGRNLQEGQKAVSLGIRGIMAPARGEIRAVECKMAAPRGRGTEPASELRESVDCVGSAGEEKVIRETCWARVVTERVTVTEREKLKEVTETCRTRHVEVTEKCTETQETKEGTPEPRGIEQETETKSQEETEIINEVTEIKQVEEKLQVIDEHTQVGIVRDNGVELGECFVTRCEQQDSLLQERGEGLCPLEEDRDEESPVEPCEVEGASAVNGCTRSLGGMEAPGALEVAQIPSVVVPVCVVTSVAKCVLESMHCVSETPCVSVMACVSDSPCVSETPCMEEARCVSEKVFKGEAPCVKETACVRSRYEREMAVGMRETATACPSAMVECVSIVARRSVCVERRRRQDQMKDKGRVAAVAISGTVPGLHSSERGVRAVLRTRPPRAHLRE